MAAAEGVQKQSKQIQVKTRGDFVRRKVAQTYSTKKTAVTRDRTGVVTRPPRITTRVTVERVVMKAAQFSGSIVDASRDLDPEQLEVLNVKLDEISELFSRQNDAISKSIEQMNIAIRESQLEPAYVHQQAIATTNQERYAREYGLLSAAEAAPHFSQSKNYAQACNRKVEAGELLSVSFNGLTRYPAFQFDANNSALNKAVFDTYQTFRDAGLDDWDIAWWFVTAQDGEAPADLVFDASRKNEFDALVMDYVELLSGEY